MSEQPRPPKPTAPGRASDPERDAPTVQGTAPHALDSEPGADQASLYDFLAPPDAGGGLGRLGPYRVLKVLGKGGMGVVFMAEDPKLYRTVALKAMLPTMAERPAAHDRFLREARAAAQLDHDNIVSIYHVEEDRGIPYLAMQFLRGLTLEEWLRRGNQPTVKQVLRIGREIAQGLAAAHAVGLIHRDIKPPNIWLDSAKKGRVKILDFGLTFRTGDDQQLTKEGTILGTPAYMSPEQARNQDVDARSDLFSLGCVLYRLATGVLPFRGSDTLAVLMALANDAPKPVRELNPEVPAELADLIHRLLAKKPADRPANAREVADALRKIERTAGSEGLPSSELVPADGARAGDDDRTEAEDYKEPRRKPKKPAERKKLSPGARVALSVGGVLLAVVFLCGGFAVIVSFVVYRTTEKAKGVAAEMKHLEGGKFGAPFEPIDPNDPVLKAAAVVPVKIGPDGLLGFKDELRNADPKFRNKPFKSYVVTLEQGKTYQIDLASGHFDAFLYLFDPQGRVLMQDDDGGANLNARIVFTPTQTADYRIHATCLLSLRNDPAAYTLTVKRR